MAEVAKAKGNAAFKAGEFAAAVDHYSDGIDLSTDDHVHVLYSNRSAAYAKLNEHLLALKDAVKTHVLKPDWPRAYVRLGRAHLGLGLLDQAICAFKLGLEISPDDGELKSDYEKAMVQAQEEAKMDQKMQGGSNNLQIFMAPDTSQRLKANPATKKLMYQSDFKKMMRELRKDQYKANNHSSDPRLLQALGFLLNVKIRSEKQPALESLLAHRSAPEVPNSGRQSKDGFVTLKKKHVIEEESEEEIELKKNVEAAIKNYITEIDLGQEIINHTVAYFSKLESGQNQNVNQLEDLKKELEKEKRTRRHLQDMIQKKFSQVIDTEAKLVQLADGNKDSGKRGPAEIMINYFTEQLRSNPEDPELYHKRSECYMELEEYQKALKDADKCIELDPGLWAGYHIKSQILVYLKEFDEANETILLGTTKKR